MPNRKLNKDEAALIDALRDGEVSDALSTFSDIVSEQEEDDESVDDDFEEE